MDHELLQILDRFASPHVMIVGDYMLDEYLFGTAERISPEAPVPVLRTRRNEFRLGGAASVASMVACLGGKVTAVGTVGTDANADRLLDLLRADGADVSGLMRISDRPTTHKLRIVGLAQLRHPQQIVRVDTEDASDLSPELEAKLVGIASERLPDSAVVCLQDYAKGVLTKGVCGKLISAARRLSKRVLVDPARIPDYAKYAGCSTLTPNRTEAMLATGLPDMDGSNAARAAEMLMTRLGTEAMVITLDKDGAFLRTSDSARLIPTKPRIVYDNAGAGDMVLATLAMALASGADWTQAVLLANLGGGLEVERFGVQPIPVAELRAAAAGPEAASAGKVRTADELVPLLLERRKRGERIVFTNGCFDLLHPGHVDYLERARRLGDVLVVGLNSDASVKRLNKGSDRPILPQSQRARMLAALSAVDFVTVFDEGTPLELVSRVQPDVLVKGEDYLGKEVVGREVVESRGGRVVLLPLVPGLSTTSLAAKLRG